MSCEWVQTTLSTRNVIVIRALATSTCSIINKRPSIHQRHLRNWVDIYWPIQHYAFNNWTGYSYLTFCPTAILIKISIVKVVLCLLQSALYISSCLTNLGAWEYNWKGNSLGEGHSYFYFMNSLQGIPLSTVFVTGSLFFIIPHHSLRREIGRSVELCGDK